MEIKLDFTNILTKEEFHKYIKLKFNLENYYDNLDSFYDLMYGVTIPLEIEVIFNKDHPLYSYLVDFYDTLIDLELENKHIKVKDL